MGTPNSQDRSGVVFEDSKALLDSIFWGISIPITALTTDELAIVVKKTIIICKPFLKYMAGFKTLQGIIVLGSTDNSHLSSRISPELNKDIISLPADIEIDTLCLLLATISCSTEGQLGPLGGEKFVVLRKLLLTRYGKLLDVQFKYERHWQHGPGTHVITTINEARALHVQEESVIDVIREYTFVVSVLCNLHSSVTNAIEEKEKHLKSIRGLLGRLDGISARLKF